MGHAVVAFKKGSRLNVIFARKLELPMPSGAVLTVERRRITNSLKVFKFLLFSIFRSIKFPKNKRVSQRCK